MISLVSVSLSVKGLINRNELTGQLDEEIW
jgi:hypothetical protein